MARPMCWPTTCTRRRCPSTAYRYGYGSAIATVLFLIMLVYISYFLCRMYQDEKG